MREAEVNLLWPHPMALGDLTFGGALARSGSDAPIWARLHATGFHGDVVAQLTADVADPDRPAARGELHVRGVQTPPGMTPAKLDLDATFDLGGRTLQTARGQIALNAKGTVTDRRIDQLKVDATLEGGMARADFTVKTPGASAQGHADVRLGEEIAIEASRVRAELADLGAVKKGLAGRVSADVRVTGTPRALAAAGQITADGVVAGSARVRTAKIDFDMGGLPRSPRGKAGLHAEGVTAGGQAIGRVLVDAAGDGKSLGVRVATGGPNVPFGGEVNGRVTLAAKETRIAFGVIELTARGLPFHGKGGAITLEKNGAITADKIKLASSAGTVAIEGELAPPHPAVGRYRPFPPEGQLHLHLDQLDLAKLQKAFAPELRQEISGIISLDAHVLREGANLGLEGDLLARQVATGGKAPPIDATATINLAEGRLVTTAHVRERLKGGVVDLALQAKVPKNVLDAGAWKDLDLETALQGAIIQLRQLDVGMLASLRGMRDYAGRIDGTVSARPGARAIDWDVGVRDLATPQVHGIDIRSKGTWGHDTLEGDVGIQFGGQKALDAKARLAIGLHTLFDGRVGEMTDAPLTAEASTRALPLATLRPIMVSKVRMAGELDFDAHAEGTLRSVSGNGKLSLKNASIARVKFQQFEASAAFDPATIKMVATVRQTTSGSLDLNATLDRQKANSIGAELKASQFDLGFIPALARSATDALAGVGGKLDADVKATIDSNGRNVTGNVKIEDGSFYLVQSGNIDKVHLVATLDGKKLRVTELKGRAGSGSLDGTAEATLEGLLPKDLNVTINLDKVPVAAGSQTLELSTKGKLTGQSQGGPMKWDMTATLSDTEAKLPHSNRGGGKLQSTGPLDDVVFVDTPDYAQRTALLALTGSAEVQQESSLDLTLKLNTPGGVSVSGQELDLHANPDLTVYMRQGATEIAGGISVDHGYIELFGRRWDIDRADVSFAGSTKINPNLNIEVEHQFATTTIYVEVTGTLTKPKLDFRAEPGNYDQATILGWVLGGDPDAPSNSDHQPLEQKAVGVASNLLLGQINSQLRNVLPIDVLNVQIGEAQSESTTRIEVGKWLTDRLFVGYQARLNAPDNENVNEAEIKFRLATRWFLDAFFGDRSVGGADVLWSKKY